MAHVMTHGKLLLERLHQQREMDLLCDITIAVRDVEFRAHRNILAAFSKYFSVHVDRSQEVTTLDPKNVSRYALEKLLEFVYTGEMNISSNRLAAVRRAAMFLGMMEASQYLEEHPLPTWAGADTKIEAVRMGTSHDLASAPPSPPSPASPVSDDMAEDFTPLSIASAGGAGELGEDTYEGGAGDAGYSDEDYDPSADDDAPRQGKRRGRKPKGASGESASANDELRTLSSRKRGRGRGRWRGKVRGRGRGRGGGRSDEHLSPEGSGADAGADAHTSADLNPEDRDWEPTQSPPAKRGRPSGRGGRRGRPRGSGRGGRGGGRGSVEQAESLPPPGNGEGGDGETDVEGGKGQEEEREEGGEMTNDWHPEDAGEDDKTSWRKSRKTSVCPECNKVFAEGSSLRRHMKIHKGLKPFGCLFCSKTFRQGTQLKTHLRIHTGEKPFACSQCEKCFAQKCQLVAHCRMHHGEEKPFACELCGLKFATSSNYKIHVRLHSGEKPHTCDVCGQAFAQSSTLTYHKRRHTGEKPYQCDTCGMSFSVSSSLITHTRKHTGETPYKCSHCPSGFATSSELKKHIRCFHPAEGNPGVQCLLCGNRFISVKNMMRHQKKAHADELRHHKERAQAAQPMAIVQSKLPQVSREITASVVEPQNPDPSTPSPKASGTTAVVPIQLFKKEPMESGATSVTPVTFETDAEPTISSDTLHALVEQLRPTATAKNVQQIVIIRTVGEGQSSSVPQ